MASLSMLLCDLKGRWPLLDVSPANPSDERQRWTVKDMSTVARDQDGRGVVALFRGTPTAGYALCRASQQHDGFTTVKKICLPQEFLNKSIMSTLLWDEAVVSPFPCVGRPQNIIRVVPPNINDLAADHHAVHGAPVALCWQPCSAHGGTHCWKLLPWGDNNAYNAAAEAAAAEAEAAAEAAAAEAAAAEAEADADADAESPPVRSGDAAHGDDHSFNNLLPWGDDAIANDDRDHEHPAVTPSPPPSRMSADSNGSAGGSRGGVFKLRFKACFRGPSN